MATSITSCRHLSPHCGPNTCGPVYELPTTAQEQALAYWDEVISITRPIYKDMPLTHYNHNFFTANEDNLFHWALIRDEVAEDVEIARRASP